MRPRPDHLIGTMASSYRLTQVLGSGGVGTVYLGEHPVIGSKVAVKVLDPEVAAAPHMVERFIQEARASAQIGSPHIPRYYDFGHLADGQPFVTMEYLEGSTLADRLADQPMDLTEVAAILVQVATAMAAAHDAGIVHRDIKPENIFLTEGADGRLLVKVLDFGIAKLLEPTSRAPVTSRGFTLGTPLYCAPEQALGVPIGTAADVYALGATAFEMLTGEAPFEGEVMAVLHRKVSEEAPRLARKRPGLPRVVDETVASMLARVPAQRPPSMRAVIDALETWVVPIQRTPARRARWPWLGLAAGVLAAGTAALGSRVPLKLAPPPAPPRRTPAHTPAAQVPVVRSAPIDLGFVAAAITQAIPEPAPRKRRVVPPAPRDDGVIVDPFADEEPR